MALNACPFLGQQRSGTGHGQRHAVFRRGAVAVQAALAMLLLVVAGLFARTLYNLKSFDPGFRTGDVLSFAVDPALGGYSPARGHQFAG